MVFIFFGKLLSWLQYARCPNGCKPGKWFLFEDDNKTKLKHSGAQWIWNGSDDNTQYNLTVCQHNWCNITIINSILDIGTKSRFICSHTLLQDNDFHIFNADKTLQIYSEKCIGSTSGSNPCACIAIHPNRWLGVIKPRTLPGWFVDGKVEFPGHCVKQIPSNSRMEEVIKLYSQTT